MAKKPETTEETEIKQTEEMPSEGTKAEEQSEDEAPESEADEDSASGGQPSEDDKQEVEEEQEPEKVEPVKTETPEILQEQKEPDSTDEKPADEPVTKDYTVHGCNIRHNGKIYKEGTKIPLTADEALNLQQYVRA